MKRCFFVGVFILLLPLVAIASVGSLKIDRVWSSGDYEYALVTYTNNTNAAYEVVTIQCTAIDASDNKVGTNTRSFFSFEHGPIRPGFQGTVEVPVELNGASIQSMSCGCRGI